MNKFNQEDKKQTFPRFSQLKYLPKALNKKEKILSLCLIIILILSLGFLSYQQYTKRIEVIAKDGGKYTEGVVGTPKFINPIYSQTNDVDSDLTKLIYRGLMKYNNNQELVPDLAESYEISKDKKIYTFKLKNNIKWHNNEPFTTDDVIFTVSAIKNPEYQSPLQINFEGVEVSKIDDYTVQFTLLKDKYSPFLTENTLFGIIPKKVWESIPPKNAPFSEQNLVPVGSGPFKFKEYKKDKTSGQIISYTLEKFNDYYGKKPYLSEIIFKFYNDYPDLITAYNKKQIDAISYVPFEEQQNIKKEINSFSLNLPHYYAIFFNTNENDALKYKPVRQALSYAVDREKIVNEILNKQAIQIDSPILPNYQEYNPDSKKYNLDLEKAKKTLKKGGWNKKENVLSFEDTKLEVTLTIINQPEFQKIAEIIKSNWESIGAKVNIEALEATDLQSNYIRPRKYQALLYGQLLGHDPDPYPFWHSSQTKDPGLNLSSLERDNIDKLLETARQQINPEERKKTYQKFQELLINEAPAIFLYSPTYLYGQNKKIKGFNQKFTFVPSDRFSDVENWYIKTKLKIKN
ncbi:MAG: ABC transporter substrate-binding protein [Patescibacteria group bacterium]|nr:ABC transporter substrate-binding protein [Patescibacteria group bacterium]